MRPLYGHSETVARLVQRLLGHERDFGECQAIGVIDGHGRLIGGAVFHNYAPEAGVIEISAASLVPNWATRRVLRAIFGYPFDDLGCQMLVARTSENNERPLRLWRSLGVDEFRIPRLRGRDEAEIITTLTVEQWRKTPFARREEVRVGEIIRAEAG